MQLRRVRVQNIRSYEAAELEFGGGTTLLSGDVGSGKTSLLYAIEMALFGVAEVNAAYLVRHGAARAEVAVAFEGGGHEYEIFRRFRRLRRKGQETFEAERIRFTVDGAETSYSATELRQQVIDLLGFPDNPSPQAHSDLWRWAVYVPQERMRDILGARPQDRLETVRKALGVERYRTAAENAQELATDLRRSAAAWRAEADRLKHFELESAAGTADAASLRNERLTLEAGVRVRESTVAGLRTARADLEQAARRADADERELVGLERDQANDRRAIEGILATLRERTDELARRRAESEAARVEAALLEARRASVVATEREVGRLRQALEESSLRLQALSEGRAVVRSAETRLADASRAVELRGAEAAEAKRLSEESLAEGPTKEPTAPTPEHLSRIEERLAEARAAESQALGVLARAENELHELEELRTAGICPRCHQAVRPAEFEAHRGEAARALEGARLNRSSAERERERLEAERSSRERYERTHDRWKEAERRRAAAQLAVERADAALAGALEDRASAERALSSARQRAAELEPEEATGARLRAELAHAEEEASEHSRAVERSALAEERRRGTDRSVELLVAEQARLERDHQEIQQRFGSRASRITDLTGGREVAIRVLRELGETERSLRSADEALTTERSALARVDARLDEAVRRVAAAEAGLRARTELLREAAETEEKAQWVGQSFREAVLTMEQKLLTHAQALFEREFARYFASLVDDPGLVARTDPAFTPLVMIEGEWTPAEALSGGERTSLALAFRLALARVVRAMGSLHLDTILLDEPTDGFSPEQVIRMGELLDELALPQVILVSHESELAAVADRVVRVQKVDGRSVLDHAPPPDPGPVGPGAE